MTKQTIIGRVAQLGGANVDGLLEQAEDPQEMADQLIREYDATIKEADEAMARTLDNLRLLEQDHAEDVSAAAEWGAKAAAASRKGDELRGAGNAPEADRFDRLAKVALGRQLRSEKEARAAEPVLSSQRAVVDRLRAGLDDMQERQRVLRAKRDELVARSRDTQARTTVPDGVTSVDVLDPTSELGRFEAKVRREEARARGRQELAASSLDAQFESLDGLGDDAEIDSRLARLKSGAA